MRKLCHRCEQHLKFNVLYSNKQLLSSNDGQIFPRASVVEAC